MTRRHRPGVWIVLLCVPALAPGGCKKKEQESPDAPALAALAPYGAQAKLSDQGRVVELKLEGQRVDNAALDHVKGLAQLKTLSLYGSSVTDDGLAKLRESPALEALGLGRTGVTRRGLAHLERLPALRWLWVNETKVTPAEAEDFKKKAVPGITVYR
ncbi:hypothetical protein R5W24_004017 [Gemmata sp. JC717]|uniref:hypothetical protein n=1 Tax=Gemmata algarum TaxID=2975278 RepID=UPI0021BAE4B9|nr:hypothetical protein [Gemmata algarum]MDY3554886.1 hypothetical protein [Gemmata algarum]